MYGKSNYKIEKETKTTIDEEGNESTTTVEKTIQFQDNNEPEFIKLYTRVWCEFNEIPLSFDGPPDIIAILNLLFGLFFSLFNNSFLTESIINVFK